MEAKLFVFAAVAISEVFSACAPSDTKFENFQKTPKRSIRYKIGVVSKKCPGLNEFYYRWTVQEIPGRKTLRATSDSSLSIDGYSFSPSNCFLVEYLVTVRVSHYPDMTYADQKKEIFHFVPDQMHIDILGGYEKSHPFGVDLVMDAKTLSRDLSYHKSEDAFAGNGIRWTMPKEFKGFRPPNNLVITVPARFLRDNTHYLITITVKRTKIPQHVDIKKMTQIIHVFKGIFPQLNILCLRNCINPHPLEITVFAVNCTRNCNHLEYDWLIEPSLDDKSKIDFGDGYDTVVVLNGAYREGQRIKVSIKSGPSYYSKLFEYSKGVLPGNCNIHPKVGISAVTKFRINCTGFRSPHGLVIYNIYQRTGPDFILINEESYFDESEVYLLAAKPLTLLIEVLDNAYLNAFISLEATVNFFQPQDNVEPLSAVKQLVLSSDHTSITSYSLEGYNNEAVQLITSLLETLEYLKVDNKTKMDLHKHMVEALVRMHPPKFAIASQVLQILLKLELYRSNGDSQTAELMVRAMADATVHVHEMRNHGHDKNIPQSLVENFVLMTLRLIKNVLRKSKTILEILNNPTIADEYDSYDEYESIKVQIRDDYKKILKNVLITVKTNSITALYGAIPDEKPKHFQNAFLSFTAQRFFLLASDRLIIKVANGTYLDTVLLIPYNMLKELSDTNHYADFQSGVFLWNPFWWHEHAKAVQTYVILFDVFFGCDKVKNLNSHFYIQFEILSQPNYVVNGTLTDKRVAGYRIELGGHRILVMRFDTVFDQFNTTDYKITWADCYCTKDDFQSERSKIIQLTTNYTDRYLEIPNYDSTVKVIFICVQKLSTEVAYRMTFATFSCLYWDIKSDDWSVRGCQVVTAGLDPGVPLLCQCKHFSLFAGHVSVPPNSLALHSDIDFTIDFVENYLMFNVVTGIIILGIVSLILAHYRDQTMKRRNIVLKLDDNVPGDPYAYLVVFFTGIFFDASTTADVSFQLVGDQANSRIHLIKCGRFKLLQRNTQAWFTIYCPHYLGQLRKIKIWHNTKGKYPHWYCERVIVQDLKTATQYCFTVEKWFSLIWGEGKIYREIQIGRHPENPNMLFLAHLENDLRDNHIWISIVVRDVQSNFNNKERVGTGFCFLFMAMMANVLFSGLPTGAPTDSVEQNKLYLTLPQLLIFFESWLISLVMALLVIFLFRNSRPL